jgi:hypothetical protein
MLRRLAFIFVETPLICAEWPAVAASELDDAGRIAVGLRRGRTVLCVTHMHSDLITCPLSIILASAIPLTVFAYSRA